MQIPKSKYNSSLEEEEMHSISAIKDPSIKAPSNLDVSPIGWSGFSVYKISENTVKN